MEKFKMLKNCGISASKVWRKITVKKRDGSLVNIQIVDLPNDRFEDFMDFNMKYYVKHEITHRVAGISKNADAMTEYRQYFTSIMKNNPSYAIHVWCPEQNGIITPEIVGMSAIKLIKSNELGYDTTQLKTKEVKKFFDILRRWNDLCPVPDIMRTYGLDTFYDDGGLAMHPEYLGAGLANTCPPMRVQTCKAKGVPMTGAWLTSPASAKACLNDGWTSVFEISYDELSKKLGITFENPPPKCCYMIATP